MHFRPRGSLAFRRTAPPLQSFAISILVGIAYFFFVFAPRIAVGLPLNLGVLAFLIVLVLGRQYLAPLVANVEFLALSAFLLLLGLYDAVVGSIYNNDPQFIIRIVISLICYLVFGHIIGSYLGKHDENYPKTLVRICRLFLACALLNSLLILLESFSPSVRRLIEGFLYTNNATNALNYLTHPFQVRGFAAAGGAGLSLANGLAIWICAALILLREYPMWRGLLLMVLVATATVFVGRTGLIVGLFGLTVFLFMQVLVRPFTGLRAAMRAIGLIAATVAFAVAAYKLVNADSEVIGWAFEWLSGVSRGTLSSASSDDLRSMLFLPQDASHTLFGIGFFEGSTVFYPRTDSGYLKTLLSVGLPLSVLLYSVIFVLLLRIALLDAKTFILIFPMLLIMAVVEIKEPFLYQNFAARFLFTIIGASLRYAVRSDGIEGRRIAKATALNAARGRSHAY